ncbi:MAG TPA: GNAT family N-acetyltransferase [Flavobacteriales bacterium]|nr:GNAT family N-acetyltransferase [Flavobacteriales bacterium]
MSKTLKTPVVDVNDLPLVDEPEMRQFVMHVGELRARMEYDRHGDRIFLTRTEVPKQLQEQGVATVLTEKTLSHLEASKMKLVPLCPKVKDFLRQNPSWQRLLLKGVQLR